MVIEFVVFFFALTIANTNKNTVIEYIRIFNQEKYRSIVTRLNSKLI